MKHFVEHLAGTSLFFPKSNQNRDQFELSVHNRAREPHQHSALPHLRPRKHGGGPIWLGFVAVVSREQAPVLPVAMSPLWGRPHDDVPPHPCVPCLSLTSLLPLDTTKPPQNAPEFPARTRPCSHPRAPVRGGRAWSPPTDRPPLPPPTAQHRAAARHDHHSLLDTASPHFLHHDHRAPADLLYKPRRRTH